MHVLGDRDFGPDSDVGSVGVCRGFGLDSDVGSVGVCRGFGLDSDVGSVGVCRGFGVDSEVGSGGVCCGSTSTRELRFGSGWCCTSKEPDISGVLPSLGRTLCDVREEGPFAILLVRIRSSSGKRIYREMYIPKCDQAESKYNSIP